MTPPLPRLAAWLLAVAVPERWADSVAGDLEAEWLARRDAQRVGGAAAAWTTMQAARIAARFAVEGAWRLADAVACDTREAVRALARRPRFASAAILTLALGVGINTAVFTIVDRVLLAPLPFADPARLVEIRGQSAPGAPPSRTVSNVDADLWRDALSPLAAIAAYQVDSVHARADDGSDFDALPVAFATPNLFEVLGVLPVAGRAFTGAEGRFGGPGAVVIAEHVWRTRFGARPGVIGRPLIVNGSLHTIVGIAAAGVEFPPGVGAWIARDTGGERLRRLGIEFASLRLVARLAGDALPARARADLAIRGRRVAAESGRESTPIAVPLDDALVGTAAPVLGLAWAAVGFLLLIACANAGSLLLARTSSRSGELAVRASLGAGRWALVRHVLVEGVVLSACGGIVGLAVASAIVRLVDATEPGVLPRLAGAHLSMGSAMFAAGTSLTAGLLVGLVPALRAGALRHQWINAPRRPAGLALGRHRIAGAMVAGQLALCVVLLVAATMTGWGVARRLLADPGFDPDRLAVLSMRPATGVAGDTGGVFTPLLDRVREVTGITGAAITDHLPPSDAGLSAAIALEGRPVPPAGAPTVRVVGVSGGYFGAMGIPVTAGRAISDDDVARDSPVALVSASLAGGDDLVGRRLVMFGRVYQVVGVAGDVRQAAMGAGPEPAVYRPIASGAFGRGGVMFLSELFLVARIAGEPASMAPTIRAIAAAPPQGADVTASTTMEQRLWASLATARFEASLFALLAALGAVLAATGLYGVVSYMVQAGAAEIGVRLALGATPRAVVEAVVRQGLGVGLVGLLLGLAMAPAAAGLVSANLEGAADAGPGVWAAVTSLLLAIVVAASALPARRASRLDPVNTLRCE